MNKLLGAMALFVVVVCVVWRASGDPGGAEAPVQPVGQTPSMAESGVGLEGAGTNGATGESHTPTIEVRGDAGESGKPLAAMTAEVRAQVIAEASQSALAFYDRDSYLAEKLVWEVDGQRFSECPVALLSRGKVLTEEGREAVSKEVESFDAAITDSVFVVDGLMRRYASLHAANLTHVKKGEPHEVTFDPELPEPEYVASTRVSVGRHDFIVDFRSSDYPELQAAMDAASALGQDRLRSVELLILGL